MERLAKMTMISNAAFYGARGHSTRLAQRSLSGNSRPSAAIPNAVMDILATDGFGLVKNMERSTGFFKKNYLHE